MYGYGFDEDLKKNTLDLIQSLRSEEEVDSAGCSLNGYGVCRNNCAFGCDNDKKIIGAINGHKHFNRLVLYVINLIPKGDRRELLANLATHVEVGSDTGRAVDRFKMWSLSNMVIEETSSEELRKCVVTAQDLLRRSIIGDEPLLDEWMLVYEEAYLRIKYNFDADNDHRSFRARNQLVAVMFSQSIRSGFSHKETDALRSEPFIYASKGMAIDEKPMALIFREAMSVLEYVVKSEPGSRGSAHI